MVRFEKEHLARFAELRFERNDPPPTVAALMMMERMDGLKEGFKKGVRVGLNDGIEIGLTHGFEAAKKSVAQTLLQDFDVDYVAKLTKLSVKEVEKLKESLS